MDEASYILTAQISCWVSLLGTLVGWDSPNLGVWANLLKESSKSSIVDEPIGFLLGSELVLPLGYLQDSETGTTAGLQLVLNITPRSKVRDPGLVVSPSWSTLVVTPAGYNVNSSAPTSGMLPTSHSQDMLAVNLSGVWHTLPWRCGAQSDILWGQRW